MYILINCKVKMGKNKIAGIFLMDSGFCNFAVLENWIFSLDPKPRK